MGVRTGLVLPVSIALLCGAAVGQDDAGHRLPDRVHLARLLDLCAERLDMVIQYDPKTVEALETTVRLRRPLKDEELWSLANELLTLNNLTSVQGAGSDLITIARVADAPNLARVEPGSHEEAVAGFVTLLVELEHRDSKIVMEAVKPLLSKTGGAITALGSSDLILLSDARPRLDQILAVLERIDVPAEPLMETIPIGNLPAPQLVALVTAASTTIAAVTGTPLAGKVLPSPDGDAVILIAPEDEAEQWRGLIARFDARQAIERRTYAPRYFAIEQVAPLLEEVARDRSPRGSGERWRVITDELTGTLMVTATPLEHEAVQALVARLDAVPVAAQRPMRSLPIRNRGVGEVLEILSSLIEAGALEAAEEPGMEPAPEAGASLPRQQTRREVLPPASAEPTAQVTPPVARPSPAPDRAAGPPELTLTADEGTNTLIAVGDPRRLKQLEDLIRALDVRQPQVMLEVLVLGLTEADTLDLGVELEKIEMSGSTLIRLASLFGLGEAGVMEGDEPSGTGGTALVLNPGDFRVLVRALETVNEGRTLNIPKVLVSNNQQAVLDSVLQQPFTSTNASDTVATTSFGGTQDAGTSVTVTPQIAEGDHLVLEYSVSLSSFVGESTDPTLPPPRQQNTLESVVSVPDGYTIVVGGLESITAAEGVSQVPFLGSVPILGEVFKNRSKSASRTRFYVFIRANVLRRGGFDDLKYLSDRDAAVAGVDDGWPQVEPRIIR